MRKTLTCLSMVLLVGCSRPIPNGAYVGYVDISGDRIKFSMDFRSDGTVLSFAEKTSSSNNRNPADYALSLLEGGEEGMSWYAVRMIVDSYKIPNGSWKLGGVGNTVEVFRSKEAKDKSFTVKIEPNGDLIVGPVRLSSRPGAEPEVKIDLREVMRNAKKDGKKPN